MKSLKIILLAITFNFILWLSFQSAFGFIAEWSDVQWILFSWSFFALNFLMLAWLLSQRK
jgi:hypothetical protein